MSQAGANSLTGGGGGGSVDSVTQGVGIIITGTATDPIVNLNVPVSVANGGTNATAMANTNGVNYFDGTRLVTTTVGTAGQVLTSNGAGVSPTFQTSGASGIQTINGDTGSATGSAVTVKTGQSANNSGASVVFAASGSDVQLNVTDSNTNTYIGTGCGTSATGFLNTAVGPYSMFGNSTGNYNCVLGAEALFNLQSGNNNIAIGYDSGYLLSSGSYNIMVGESSGYSLTLNDSSNIIIGSSGSSGDNNTLRIGNATGSGIFDLNKAFISGIYGITPALGSAIQVFIDSAGQLGTVVSSERFKENIESLPHTTSEKIYALNPSKFTLKNSPGSLQFGLIAEDVMEILPELVVLDSSNKPFSVKYHELPVLLLNEIKKLREEIDILKTNSCQNGFPK